MKDATPVQIMRTDRYTPEGKRTGKDIENSKYGQGPADARNNVHKEVQQR